MINTEILENIIAVLEQKKGQDGWTDLARIGKPLADIGINPKALGHIKLTELLEEYDEFIEIRRDSTSYKVPVLYAKQKNNGQKLIGTKPKVQVSRDYSGKAVNNLMQWAWMGDFSQVINDLKNMALKERWYYKIQNPDFPFPILSKYLTYTFYRLLKESDKIKISNQYASFNTGLVNKLYEPIYALFERNKVQGKQEWYFHEFCISGVGKAGKILARNFNPLPERANYFSNPSELIYDSNAPEPQLNWNHIILDNVSRLPLEFLEDNKPEGFNFRDTSDMTTIQKSDYYSALASAIESDSRKFRAIKNRFSDSLNLALKRVEWNFKTAIPMYYPAYNKMSLLLPMSLVDDDTIDLALVTEKTQSGNYLGHTILPLNWAYSNARLITRPDSDWLVADRIETESDSEIDDTEE
ncbi:DUF3825 domain-containing protein [Arenibacter amylolyticus]|uniref:DUF3825 domain-containing protein n=1 Tax=Arenibacter amylolyticus TaxID=1406873 RepID=UPI000A383B5A|nr:DUF3825 domain-containing protein [Arenibacter amylolyticus]